ncbi:MAG: hypothetical protein RJA70_351 [Pseudomonadota bacterium]|jgi:ATP-dependent RNA helicase RhlE
MQFKDLGLVPELLRAVEEAGYVTPTPIQAAAIPDAIEGRDILGCAQTGTGKTAAFCLPALHQAELRAGDEPVLRTLILTPTRELAAQINDSLKTYGKHLELWHTVIFGGVNEKPQIAELKRGVDILVATPGRLLDLMNRGFVKLDKIEIFVLDEADRMLDMGFIHDVRKVTKALPKKRQTLFFSATMPPAIRELANGLLVNPKVAAVDPVSSTVDAIKQFVYYTDKGIKRDLLVHILKNSGCERTIVFTRTKHGSDRVVRHLEKCGMSAAAIHGNKAQNARTRALEGFRSGKIAVLVATDIAARGIDVDGISHVINFDIPNVPETYVHRIGRTARAGATGTAISLCEYDERTYLHGIERLTGITLEKVDDHPFPAGSAPPPVAEPANGGAGGRGHAPRGGGGGGGRGHSSRGGSGGGGGRGQANPGGGRSAQPSAGRRGMSAVASGS